MTVSAEPDPLEWTLDDRTRLRPLRTADAEIVHRLIARNRAHLDRWLRWSAGLETVEAVGEFLAGFERRERAAEGFHLGVYHGGELAGGLVCWYIQRQNRNAEIGYWLGESATGRGLATRSAARAIRHLFQREGLHRIEMQCAVENAPSRRVAERLGFTMEGTRRDSHWITDRFRDHVVYGLLEAEWRALTPASERGLDNTTREPPS